MEDHLPVVQNLFRQALSNLIARSSQLWHVDRATSFPPVALEPEVVIKQIRRLERETAIDFNALQNIPHLKLSHEDDLLKAEHHQSTAEKPLLTWDWNRVQHKRL